MMALFEQKILQFQLSEKLVYSTMCLGILFASAISARDIYSLSHTHGNLLPTTELKISQAHISVLVKNNTAASDIHRQLVLSPTPSSSYVPGVTKNSFFIQKQIVPSNQPTVSTPSPSSVISPTIIPHVTTIPAPTSPPVTTLPTITSIPLKNIPVSLPPSPTPSVTQKSSPFGPTPTITQIVTPMVKQIPGVVSSIHVNTSL